MENRVENYKTAIAGFIKEGMIKEAMSAVDSLSDHSYRLGLEAKPKVYVENDEVNHPGHYQSYSPELQIECIDAMRAAFGDDAVALWCKLNAFKYIWRESSKGQSTDVKKAIWYLNKYLELDEDNE